MVGLGREGGSTGEEGGYWGRAQVGTPGTPYRLADGRDGRGGDTDIATTRLTPPFNFLVFS